MGLYEWAYVLSSLVYIYVCICKCAGDKNIGRVMLQLRDHSGWVLYHNVYWCSSIVPSGCIAFAYDDWEISHNQLPITETIMNMTDISNISVPVRLV